MLKKIIKPKNINFIFLFCHDISNFNLNVQSLAKTIIFNFLSLQHIHKSKFSLPVEVYQVKCILNLYSVLILSLLTGNSFLLIHSLNLHLPQSSKWPSSGPSTNLYWSLPKRLQRAVNPPQEVLQLPTEEAH